MPDAEQRSLVERMTADLADPEQFMRRIEERMAAEKSAMSIFGFNLYAPISDIKAKFACEPMDDSEWITHECLSGNQTLYLQTMNTTRCADAVKTENEHGSTEVSAPCHSELIEEVVVGLKGIEILSASEADSEIQRVVGLIGPPDTQNNAREREYGGYGPTKRLVWGEGRLLSDLDREIIDKEFSIYIYPEDLFSLEKNGPVKFHKSVFSSTNFKSKLSLGWDPALEGAFSLFRWFLLSLVWVVSLTYHSAELHEKPTLLSYLMDVGKVIFFSALITIIFGTGGEICSDSDMFGCNEYSGEYREPWSISRSLEFFVKVCGVALLGWWMALRGYRFTSPP